MTEAIKFPKTRRATEVFKEETPPEWKRAYAAVEEKLDGANAGVWFERGEMRLQSRGHVLHGNSGAQFAPFHAWAHERGDLFRTWLGDKCVLYGEWLFAKHRAFYDALPDLFVGYDVLDRKTGNFLSSLARNRILTACRVQPVASLWMGAYAKAPAFGGLIGLSRYKTPRWREALLEEARRSGVRDPMDETDDSDLAEGVVVRVESGPYVVGRFKLHREGFEKVSSEHWRERPLIRNRVRTV